MATIITKNSSTASAVPAAGDLVKGELAVNVTDKKVYTKDNSAAIVKLVGSLGNQESNAVAITGGTINGTTIGATTPSTGAFTTASASSGFTGNLTGNVTGNVSGTASNVTGVVAIANGGTGLSSLGTGVQTALGQAVTGSGSFVLSTSPSLTTPNLGTPSAAVLTNATGLPLTTGVTGTLGVANGGTGITAFGTGVATALGQSVTGSGGIVLATSPSLTTPNLGTPSAATLTNATGLPISTGVSGLGTGVATALAVNTGSSGAFVVNGGALGTPSSGTVTNLTGTASININGTVGATTPTTGAFTTTTISTSETLSYGTANGVAYLNGSKVLTTGSALTFDGTRLFIQTTSSNITSNERLTVNGVTTTSVSSTIAPAIYAQNSDTTASTNQPYIYLHDGSASRAGLGVNYTDSALVLNGFGGIYFRYGGNGLGTTEGMRLTSTGLGIGTSSPDVRLSVEGDVRIRTGGTLRLNNPANNASSGIYTNSSSALVVQTGGADRLTIDSSGNLGLGVTPSASTIAQFEGGSNLLLVGRGNAYLSNNATFNSGFKYINTSTAGQYIISGSTHLWYTAPSGTAGNAISFTQAMTLDASGNWMTGTTTAIGRATVVGGTSQLAFHDGNGSNTNYGLLNYGGSSGELTLNANSTGGNTLIRFLTSNSGSNAERARITAGGNLLVGTTTNNASGGVIQVSNGITFPATQSASSDANTLDDYEEGTFTPTVSGSTSAGTGTYTIQVGAYTKVGRQVSINIWVAWTAHTGTGNLQITNLPFTSNSTTNLYNSVTIGFANNLALSSSNVILAHNPNNTTRIDFYQYPAGGGANSLVPIDTDASVMVSVTYFV